MLDGATKGMKGGHRGLRGMRLAMMQTYYRLSVSHWAIVVWSIIQDAYFGY